MFTIFPDLIQHATTSIDQKNNSDWDFGNLMDVVWTQACDHLQLKKYSKSYVTLEPV